VTRRSIEQRVRDWLNTDVLAMTSQFSLTAIDIRQDKSVRSKYNVQPGDSADTIADQVAARIRLYADDEERNSRGVTFGLYAMTTQGAEEKCMRGPFLVRVLAEDLKDGIVSSELMVSNAATAKAAGGAEVTPWREVAGMFAKMVEVRDTRQMEVMNTVMGGYSQMQAAIVGIADQYKAANEMMTVALKTEHDARVSAENALEKTQKQFDKIYERASELQKENDKLKEEGTFLGRIADRVGDRIGEKVADHIPDAHRNGAG
jgi:hypothetical protein